MKEEIDRSLDVNLKDVIYYLLKNIKVVIILGLVFTCIGLGYSYVNAPRDAVAVSSNVLDTTVKLPGESDDAFNNRVANVERTKSIMENIVVLTRQVEIQEEYIENSLLMQIDPLSVFHTDVQIVLECNTNVDGAIDSLRRAYISEIQYGDYLISIADEMDCPVGSVQELIICNPIDSEEEIVLDSTSSEIDVITIRVVGSSYEITDTIMDEIETMVLSKTDYYSSSIINHSIRVIGRQHSVSYDDDLRNYQLDSLTILNTIQTQINDLNNNLDNLASILGFSDRTSLCDSINNCLSIEDQHGEFRTDVIKYGFIGCFFGIFLAFCVIVWRYSWGRCIVSQAQFFDLYTSLQSIGVFKPNDTKNKYQEILDRWSGDDYDLSEETVAKLISANYRNMTKDLNNVFITGTVYSSLVKERIDVLGISSDIHLGFFSDGDILSRVSEYDGVVIVEQRGLSKKKLIKEQIKLLSNSGIRIIGAIIV